MKHSRTARPIEALFFAALAITTLLPSRLPAAEEPTKGIPGFIGWIPMQPVMAGDRLLIDLHRFYFAKVDGDDRLDFPESVPGKFRARADMTAFQMLVEVDKNASGLIEIPLRVFRAKPEDSATMGRKDMTAAVNDEESRKKPVLEAVLLIGVQHADGYLFTYKPAEPGAKKVCVAGPFNNWNTGSHELRPAGDGTYQIFVRLPAGSHPYKLVVDGKWMLDPGNPEKLDDGTGNENSIARVGTPDRGKPPVVFARESDGNRAVFHVVKGGTEVVQVSSVLQLPEGSSKSVPNTRSGDELTVDTSGAPAGSWVRVVVCDDDGNVSNAARALVKPTRSFQWQDGIIYYAFTDRFADGDKAGNRPVDDERVPPQANYQGGDFQGITKKIDEGYFRDLGVNVLWLAPLNRNPDGAWMEYLPPHRYYTGYHGYWPVSHNEVEPRFGGERALKEMIGAAHLGDMFIIADLVLKHVHTDHPLWK